MFDEIDKLTIPSITGNPTTIGSLRKLHETEEEREAKRLAQIYDLFDEYADSDEARMGLVELIELCGGEVPSDICTACGSDEARYTSHYNNNAECQS